MRREGKKKKQQQQQQDRELGNSPMAEKDSEEQSSCGFLVDGRASIDNAEPWMQYSPEVSLGRNYYSDLLGGMHISSAVRSAGDSIPGGLSRDYSACAGGGLLDVDCPPLQNDGSGVRFEVQFPCDAAATSSSGGSLGSPANGGREDQKKMQIDMEDRECQSEEVHEESGDNSKQPSTAGTSSSKRTRAAQVHNLSEKRRRNRINEKMKALQNLIPNSNKTDKASMLDEAIDYLKQLQLQVQMLSARNGIDASPMHMLSALSHVQMPQTCASSGHAGIALNMGRRTGLLNITQGTPGQSLLSVHDPYTRGLNPMPIPYVSTTGVNVGGSMQSSCEMDGCSQVHLSLPQVPTTSQEIYTAFYSQRQ